MHDQAAWPVLDNAARRMQSDNKEGSVVERGDVLLR